jgi:hypothetical protein
MAKNCARSCHAPADTQPAEVATATRHRDETSSDFPDSILRPHYTEEEIAAKEISAKEFAAKGLNVKSTPEDTMAWLGTQIRTAQQEPEASRRTQEETREPEAPANVEATATVEQAAPQAPNSSSNYTQCQAHLHVCEKQVEKIITYVREQSFIELDANHDKDLKHAMLLHKKQTYDRLEELQRSARKKELQLNAQIREMVRRAEKAEHRIERITSGEDQRDLQRKVDMLEHELTDAEQARAQLEQQIAERMELATSRETQLDDALKTSKFRADTAGFRVKKLWRQLWLRKRRLVRKNPNLLDDDSTTAALAEKNSSATDAAWLKQCVSMGNGICRKKRKGEVELDPSIEEATSVADTSIQPGLPAGALTKTILEAMQILSPLQDSAIWQMYADLCLTQSGGASNPCDESRAFRATSWFAAFAWVAVWRCVWLLLLRYFINCCGGLAVRSVYLWDHFSDWFFGFSSRELAAQEF